MEQPPQPAVDRRKDGTGTLHVIPDHVLSNIFTLFTYKELVYFSAVSPAFYIFCNDDTLWQEIYLQGTNSTFHFDGMWKHATLQKYKTNAKTLELPKRFTFEGIYSMFLYSRWYRAHTDVSKFFGTENGIEKIKKEDLSPADFINNYDALSRPVMFTGVTDHWTAHKNWSRENLLKVYGDTDFKVSERGSRKFKMKLRDYLRYLDVQQDEDPLYIFDSGFGERAPDMLKDYEIPPYFPDDFFNLLGRHKPSFRWYVMGPPRSGAPWHVDPAGTSAWNALLHGRKRWLLYPFLEVEDRPIEIIQNPGDVIFVPGGWWHMVLNLEESTAVTQNYANSCNFNAVCEDFFNDRREVYFYFKQKMLEAHPEYEKQFEQFEQLTDEVNADFDDVEFWGPYITEVLKRHNLPVPDVKDISPLSDGTNPVFTAKDMVVKFYSKRFGGQRNFEAETGMYNRAKSTTIEEVCPKLLGEGKIEVKQTIKAKALDRHANNMSDGADFRDIPSFKGKENGVEGEKEVPKDKQNGTGDAYPAASVKGKTAMVEVKEEWPYLIMSFITGDNLVSAREEELEVDMGEVSLFLARNAPVIHGLKVEGGKEKQDPRDDYKLFLEKRKDKALKAHWQWRSLPVPLIQQIEAYLPINIEEVINNEHVFTLHGDLTDENVIGVEVKKTGKRPKRQEIVLWKPKYIIDFGDSRQGDVAYEFVSLYISVLECNKTQLEIFFKSYLLPDGSTYWDYYNKNNSTIVKKFMVHTLLHECDALATAFRHFPEARESKTLEELAIALWEL